MFVGNSSWNVGLRCIISVIIIFCKINLLPWPAPNTYLGKGKIVFLRNCTSKEITPWEASCCPQGQEYIDESVKAFGERLKDHFRVLLQFMLILKLQVLTSIWAISLIMGRESHNLTRTINEAIYIRINDTFLNRKIWKYHLLHIWNEVLFNILDLKLR